MGWREGFRHHRQWYSGEGEGKARSRVGAVNMPTRHVSGVLPRWQIIYPRSGGRGEFHTSFSDGRWPKSGRRRGRPLGFQDTTQPAVIDLRQPTPLTSQLMPTGVTIETYCATAAVIQSVSRISDKDTSRMANSVVEGTHFSTYNQYRRNCPPESNLEHDA